MKITTAKGNSKGMDRSALKSGVLYYRMKIDGDKVYYAGDCDGRFVRVLIEGGKPASLQWLARGELLQGDIYFVETEPVTIQND